MAHSLVTTNIDSLVGLKQFVNSLASQETNIEV